MYQETTELLLKKKTGGLIRPGGLMIRNQHFHCQGLGSTPDWGTKISQAKPHSYPKKSVLQIISLLSKMHSA